jgi:anti-anti-sigma regulatory factor
MCNIQPNVLEVFKLTRLNKVFKIVNKEDAGEST